ncbi:MAG TPA: sodium:solute symporter [Vicinamibacteria bacterium]|nr:sodium:solute symporter [Vicinamibacteria bacterium]
MQLLRVGLPALVAIGLYLAGINLLGAWLGRGQRSAGDYFLGHRSMPWWAVMASVVATETSALTFLSVPGDAYRSGFAFLQLTFGYLVGRVVVAFLLLPAYFRGELPTAYALLESRFGVATRRFASLVFMVTRVMAASVRLAVPAIPIALMLGIPVWAAILILAAGTALYTYLGGIRAVIWIDLIQVLVYLSGAGIALWVLAHAIPGGLGPLVASRAGTLFDLSSDLSRPYTLWAGLLGGAFLAMASHGADQLIVQRLLACRSLRDAQRALIGSGFAVIVQFSLFLTIGIALASFFGGRPIDPSGAGVLAFRSSDEIFPAFIVGHLPPLASAWLVAGIFSAAMCSESSALNSLASALAHDIVAPVLGERAIEGRRGLWLGRLLTLLWTLVLAALSVGFSTLGQGEPAVQVALGLASVTAGGLLGAFLVGLLLRRARQADALLGVATSVALMLAVWLDSRGWLPGGPGLRIAWPWYSLLGCAIAFGVAALSSLRNRRPAGAATAA